MLQVIAQRVEAEVQQCPACQARSKAPFPASMPGPVQYGSGLQAFSINLLVAHMLSLRRTVELVKALSGLRSCEATAGSGTVAPARPRGLCGRSCHGAGADSPPAGGRDRLARLHRATPCG